MKKEVIEKAMSTGERLAVLEEKTDSLNKKVDAIDVSITTLHQKIDALVLANQTNLVSQAEFIEYKTSRQKEREQELREVKAVYWQRLIATTLVTGIVSILIGYFFAHIGR